MNNIPKKVEFLPGIFTTEYELPEISDIEEYALQESTRRFVESSNKLRVLENRGWTVVNSEVIVDKCCDCGNRDTCNGHHKSILITCHGYMNMSKTVEVIDWKKAFIENKRNLMYAIGVLIAFACIMTYEYNDSHNKMSMRALYEDLVDGDNITS